MIGRVIAPLLGYDARGEFVNGKQVWRPGPSNSGALQQWSGSGNSSSAGGGSATGGGSDRGGGSSAPLAPGQSARFTPDPTVNGPWTHTRADIPLFKSIGGSAPAAGTGSNSLPTNAIPERPTIPPNTGGVMPPRNPTPKPGQRPLYGGSRRPRRDRRAMLADILEGK